MSARRPRRCSDAITILKQRLAVDAATSGSASVLQLVPVATPSSASIATTWQRRVSPYHVGRYRHRASLRDRDARGTRTKRLLIHRMWLSSNLLRRADLRIHHWIKSFFLLVARCRNRGHSLPAVVVIVAHILGRSSVQLLPARGLPQGIPAHRSAARTPGSSATGPARLPHSETCICHLLNFNLGKLVAVDPCRIVEILRRLPERACRAFARSNGVVRLH